MNVIKEKLEMNSILSRTIDDNTPKFNPDVMHGTGEKILPGLPDYLDGVFRQNAKSLYPGIPLTYLGYRYITPKEEYNITIGNKNTIPAYDIAKYDIYPIELQFTYAGTNFNRLLYLPYCSDGNVITLLGTEYFIKPVLSDTIITPSTNKVFVRLNKSKINFESKPKPFVVDGYIVTGGVICCDAFVVNKDQVSSQLGSVVVPSVLYPLGHIGLRETFKKYLDIPDVIVTTDNVDEYRETHTVYESTKRVPRAYKIPGYRGHDIKIVVPKDVKDTEYVRSVAFGIIYTFDILPAYQDDFIRFVNNPKELSREIQFWRIMLGTMAYKDNYSPEKVYGDMQVHFDKISSYVDNDTIDKLATTGIHVESFYDLVAVILGRYGQWVINSREYTSNIDNRYIDYVYYLTYDIILGYNRVINTLNKRSAKGPLSVKEVIKIFTNEMSPKKILSITKAMSINLAIEICDSSGDIPYTKLTSNIDDQSRGNGVTRAAKATIPEAAKNINGPDLMFGSLLFLGKNVPSPRFKLNMFARYNLATGKIITPPELSKPVAKLTKLLTKRLGDND